MVGFWIRPFIGITNLGAIFANESEKAIATERYHREYTVTSSKSSVTVELPGGISREIHITYLESPYQLMQRDYTFWPPPVQIDPGSVDEFTVVFPDIFVNGEKLFVPPIHFKKASGGKVNLILNC